MYDELIKRLREADISHPPVYLFGRAADAIEELSGENESLAKSVNEASEILRRRWIPVTERLPSVGDKVIVAIRDESGDTRYDYTNTGWYSGNGYKWVVEDEYCSLVTHWMPLPEPPKEE